MSEPLDLDALAALEAAATPGPWQVERGGDDQDLPGFHEGLYVSSCSAVEEDDPPITGPLHNPHDAWFLVEARNALPALIERVRELGAAADNIADLLIDAEDHRQAAEARIDAVRALCDRYIRVDGSPNWDRPSREELLAALDGDA